MDELGEWNAWGREMLNYLGLDLTITDGWYDGTLRANLSFRLGAALGSLVKHGSYRDFLASFGESAGNRVASGGESIARDGGDDAGRAGAAAQGVDQVRDHDESDGDPKL